MKSVSLYQECEQYWYHKQFLISASSVVLNWNSSFKKEILKIWGEENMAELLQYTVADMWQSWPNEDILKAFANQKWHFPFVNKIYPFGEEIMDFSLGTEKTSGGEGRGHMNL